MHMMTENLLSEDAAILVIKGLVKDCPNHMPMDEREHIARTDNFCKFSDYERRQVIECGEVSCHDCILVELGYSDYCRYAAKRNIKSFKSRRRGARKSS